MDFHFQKSLIQLNLSMSLFLQESSVELCFMDFPNLIRIRKRRAQIKEENPQKRIDITLYSLLSDSILLILNFHSFNELFTINIIVYLWIWLLIFLGRIRYWNWSHWVWSYKKIKVWGSMFIFLRRNNPIILVVH